MSSKRKSLSEAWLDAGMINCLKVESKNLKYDSPNNSEWIIAIGEDGSSVVIKRPNLKVDVLINPLDELCSKIDGKEPGVYSVICSYHEEKNRDDGTVEDFYFVPEKFNLIWSAEGV